MDMYKLKFTILQLEMFRLLCIRAGERINQRQLAGLLKVSPTAVAKSLGMLEKEGLIAVQRSKRMNLTLIALNRDNKKAVQLKRAENLKMLYESGLVEFLEESNPGCTIILFGSYAKGEDIASSDMDLAIIGSKGKKLDLSGYAKKLEKEIRINYYKSFKEISKELKENLCNGILLHGGIEL